MLSLESDLRQVRADQGFRTNLKELKSSFEVVNITWKQGARSLIVYLCNECGIIEYEDEIIKSGKKCEKCEYLMENPDLEE